MLVTFNCNAHENIMMFGEVALRLIKMMGHSARVPGAILAVDVPVALSQLTEALLNEKDKTKQNSSFDEEQDVSLAHRALPLMALLNSAVKHKSDVLWT